MQITGINKQADRGSLKLGGALALEDMNLDRKADFEGDAFDPFNIGNTGSKVDLQLQAQNAYLDKANSKGGHIWSPEQQMKMQQQNQAANAQAQAPVGQR